MGGSSCCALRRPAQRRTSTRLSAPNERTPRTGNEAWLYLPFSIPDTSDDHPRQRLVRSQAAHLGQHTLDPLFLQLHLHLLRYRIVGIREAEAGRDAGDEVDGRHALRQRVQRGAHQPVGMRQFAHRVAAQAEDRVAERAVAEAVQQVFDVGHQRARRRAILAASTPAPTPPSRRAPEGRSRRRRGTDSHTRNRPDSLDSPARHAPAL